LQWWGAVADPARLDPKASERYSNAKMSKGENHWYLLGNVVDAFSRSLRPRAWQIGLWLALAVACLIAIQTGVLEAVFRHADSPAFVPLLTVLVTGLAVGAGLVWARWRLSRARSDYLKALQQPSPEALVAVVTRSMQRARTLPDADAFGAQSRAIAYTLYGDEQSAARALAEVDWDSRAPLIQAVGLSAEGIIELLCRRDAGRALELNRRASALSAVSGLVPGAQQSRRYHGTCVAVGEVLSSNESSAGLAWLEQSAADARYPPLQLLASFGLAVAMTRAGDLERAARLRRFIENVAPHCEPLQLLPGAFRTSGAASDRDPAVATTPHGPERRKVLRAGGILVGLWLLLIAALAVVWAGLSP
jgi:hypothetical protein